MRMTPIPGRGQPRSFNVTMEDIPVGQKTVRFSDLSGQLIMDDDTPARVVVCEHPELGEGPVEIEALAAEARAIEQAAMAVAIVEVHYPGEDQPRRVAMEAGVFDQLATEKPMGELLVTARPARRTTRAASAAAPREGRVNYGTLEHAGKPHKGKVTDAEKRLVQEHFDEVNERLTGQRMRAISLTDPEHIERYGLEQLADERGTDALVTLDTAVRDARDSAARDSAARDSAASDTETLMAAAG
jgi:hypothetical protein